MKYIRRYQKVREFLTDQVYGPYKYNGDMEVGDDLEREQTEEESMREEDEQRRPKVKVMIRKVGCGYIAFVSFGCLLDLMLN